MIKRHLEVAGVPEQLATIRQFLQQVLTDAGLSEEEIYRWVWVVDESCSNIIRHSYRSNPAQRIWITVTVTEQQVQVDIEDEGVPFDPSQIPEPDLQQHREQRRKGGLGIYVVRRLVDQFRYYGRQKPGERNRLVLIRQRSYNSSTIPS